MSKEDNDESQGASKNVKDEEAVRKPVP